VARVVGAAKALAPAVAPEVGADLEVEPDRVAHPERAAVQAVVVGDSRAAVQMLPEAVAQARVRDLGQDQEQARDRDREPERVRDRVEDRRAMGELQNGFLRRRCCIARLQAEDQGLADLADQAANMGWRKKTSARC
jgi:hypothetical protein